MTGVSIILPVYNALEYARQCLNSVYRVATRVTFEVIVVNNGSAPDVAAWLSIEMERRPGLTVLNFDRPLGFSKAINEGARVAQYDFLALLNSDSRVMDGWLDGLTEAIESDPRIGIASPVTNYSGPGPQLVSRPPDSNAAFPLVEELRCLFFFCVVIRRELWESLRGLDEIYGVGTYEDQDYCLRARMAGWSLVVHPGVFVFNHSSKTFQDNRIDHDECLFRNEKIFLERASCFSRTLCIARHGKREIPSTSVVVVVAEGAAAKLIDSLTSLANQTVTGFETVIVSKEGQELPELPTDVVRNLRIRQVTVPGNPSDGLGKLWNAGIAAAYGDFLAYLPAGDIYFAYHLEILHQLLTAKKRDAAYTTWSVAIHPPEQHATSASTNSSVNSSTAIRWAAISGFEARPEHLLMGAWAPLVCWIHHRSCVPQDGFREDIGSFAEWDFALRLNQKTKVWFEPGVTCEHNRSLRTNRDRAEDAASVMREFPIAGQSESKERLAFLDAVKAGIWEEALIVGRHEREYRARRLFQRNVAAPRENRVIDEASSRLAEVNATQKNIAPTPGRLDFVFLNILGWSDLTQRPHHFAKGLARRGYRVFWIDVKLTPVERFTGVMTPRILADNLFELQLPGHIEGSAGDIYHFGWSLGILELITAAFGQLKAARGIGQAVQLINFPGWTPLAKSLRRQFGWPIVYDCLDDQYAFSELYGQEVAAFEGELAQICDVLVTSGHLLLKTKQLHRRDAILIPNAADYDCFRTAASQELLDRLPRPVIGFFGAFADWLDLDWVEEAARRFPYWSFVYIGRAGFVREENKERWQRLTSAPNIHVFPQVDLATLASYLAQFDICIMPFQDLPITRSMHAVKIYEYLAAGKHVLVPALPEMREFAEAGLLVTYDNHEQSFELLETLASQPATAEQTFARTSFAQRNDWSERLDRLIQVARVAAKSEA